MCYENRIVTWTVFMYIRRHIKKRRVQHRILRLRYLRDQRLNKNPD